jgi:catechol 2,3-dioxygenase-like lactoylglutathione lyase family enzyme
MATKKKPAKKAAAKTAAAKKAPARKAPAKRPGARAAARSLSERRHQPESLRLRNVGIGLTVNDLKKSLAWYRDILGFVAGEEWRQDGTLMGVEMHAGAVTVWIGQDDWKKGHDRVKGEGIRLFGRTAQDIDRLAALIKSRGGVLSHDPRTEPWGERDFGLVDPDGFKITITTGM